MRMTGEEITAKISKSFRLRSLFITINLVVLALPILGIAALRIFENVMHRQTEAKLAAEGAFVQAIYLETLTELAAGATSELPLARSIPDPDPPVDDRWRPYFPTIDVSKQKVLSSGPAGLPPKLKPNPLAVEAGHRIEPVILAAERYNLSGVRVTDMNGVVVATNGDQLLTDISNREEVAEALKGHYSSVLRERANVSKPPWGSISRASRVRVYVAIPIMFDEKHLAGVVYLHRTSLTFFRDLWEGQYAAALIAVIAVTLAISLLLTVIVTRPLQILVRQAERIAAGEQGVSLTVPAMAPAEAHHLASALSGMVERLRRRMEYIEQFTKSVSHEFKTPLTGMQGAIEILESEGDEMPSPQRNKFIGIIGSQVRRMELLVKRLLDLARIEMSAPAAEVTDVVELIEHIAHRQREAGRDVTVEKLIPSAPVRMAADMAETLFANLIENGILHGGGKVTVTISEGPTVKVSDHGPGISSANLPRVFDRFFTTNRASGGTGLGLSLVKAVSDLHSAKIDIQTSPQGTTFTVLLKTL